MPDNKDKKKEQESKDEKPIIRPGEIRGNIEISDTSERRDGPGGN